MRGPDPSIEQFQRPAGGQLPIAMSLNSSGEQQANLVCGFIGCDAKPFNPLLATLPRLLHVRKQQLADGFMLEHLVQVAVVESAARRAGSETMLSRLSELLFIEIVRNYCAQLPSDTKGWLAGLRDDITGRSLSVLHDRPAEPWTLEELAKTVGVSRSVLAERFHAYVGAPPMQYLARWRMQLAASLLSGTNETLSSVAERVGYGSEAALSRAFKRLVGVAPSTWREGGRPNVSFVPIDEEDAEARAVQAET